MLRVQDLVGVSGYADDGGDWDGDATALSRGDRRARKRVLERHLSFGDHDSLDGGVHNEPPAKAAHFENDATWSSTGFMSGLAVLNAQACGSTPSSANVAPLPAESDGTRRHQQLKEASQRCRKRQKHEGMAYTTEINRLGQEIALLRSKFEVPALLSIEESRNASHHRFQMKRHLGFLKKKLSDHHCWLQSIRSLLASAPLFDFAVHLAKDSHRSSSHSTSSSSMVPPDFKYLNEWRGDCEQQKFSRVLMAQRVKEVVRASSQNTSNLIKQYTSRDAQFQRNFVSRGWTICTSAKSGLLAFRRQRQFPHGVFAKDVAFKLWHSIQRDDILRTFVPIVQGSILVHECDTCSISRRLIQRTSHEPQQTSVTVESIAFVDGYNAEAWQISIQTIEDHYLCLLAAEKADKPSSPMISPASMRAQTSADTEQPPGSKFKRNGNFVIAAQILQNKHSASVELVGCAQYDVPPAYQDEDASLDLLRYFVSLLPVYEELHLAQGGNA
ncbi:hypothetical protein FI667_g7237, partial [Globisporangium splendens]